MDLISFTIIHKQLHMFTNGVYKHVNEMEYHI